MFVLAPGVRHLSLPWLWILTGDPSSDCDVAIGTGGHDGVYLVRPRGHRTAYAIRGGLGGVVDLGAGEAPGSMPGLYNGEPVVTDGARFLFKSRERGWCVSREFAEPSEWDETVRTYSGGGGVSYTQQTFRRGSEFWTGDKPSRLGEYTDFEGRGSLRLPDGTRPAARVRVGGDISRCDDGLSGRYSAVCGAPVLVAGGRIGEFRATGDIDYVYQAARLL